MASLSHNELKNYWQYCSNWKTSYPYKFTSLWDRTEKLQWSGIVLHTQFNTLRPRQNGQYLAEDIFKSIFFNENVWISIEISLKFLPKRPINNIPALVQIMACCLDGAKPLWCLMILNLPMHICITWPQWINICSLRYHNEPFWMWTCCLCHWVALMPVVLSSCIGVSSLKDIYLSLYITHKLLCAL